MVVGYQHFRKPIYSMHWIHFGFQAAGPLRTANEEVDFAGAKIDFFFFGGGGDQIPGIFDSSPEKMLQNQIELCNIQFCGVFFLVECVRKISGPGEWKHVFFWGRYIPKNTQ